MEKIYKKIYDKYDLPYGLLFLLPRGYENTGIVISPSDARNLEDGTKVLIIGKINNFRVKHKTKISSIYADVVDNRGSVMVEWISSNFKAEAKKNILKSDFNERIVQVIGEVSSFPAGNGKFSYIRKVKLKEQIGTQNINIRTVIPVPIYTLKKGIKKFEIEKIIKNELKLIKENDFPKELEIKYNIPTLKESMEFVHGLRCIEKKYLNTFLEGNSIWHKRIQLEMIWITLRQLEKEKINEKSPKIEYSKQELISFEKTLPFDLTISQKVSLKSIFNTFEKGIFQRILLQGDVGSGKTMVSIFASLVVSKSEYNQIAVIAPSTVLAKQLFEEYAKFLENENIQVFLATSKMRVKEKKAIQKALDSDEAVVVLGTTSVNGFEFSRLGLVLIDEEQKLGVKSKDKLLQDKYIVPYQILMSATPIPRSLAQSIFGNVKVAKISSKPEGRLDIGTKIIKNTESVKKMFSFIYKEAMNSKKTLFVAPSIGSSEMASVEKVEKLCRQYLGEDVPLGIIHGEMAEKDIENEIEIFKKSEKNVLIATSMVEAGFSVPDMTMVVIVGPDRFGLSQLHQIRGRGGRSKGLQAYCALFPLDFKLSEKANERLNFFCKEYDGFVLSQKDLETRGSGELIGSTQSGTGKVDFISNIRYVEEMKKYI